MARIYGIDTPLAREHVRQTLQAIFKHNFKTDLSQHANAQRPGFAMGLSLIHILNSCYNIGKLCRCRYRAAWAAMKFNIGISLQGQPHIIQHLTCAHFKNKILFNFCRQST